MTQSPTLRSFESPNFTAVNLVFFGSIFKRATSVFGSLPTTLASKEVSSYKITIIFSALSITWLFVIIYPVSSIIKPEPNDCAFLFLPPGLSNCLKKSSNGDPGGNEGICRDLSSITVVVDILTTEGLNLSARSAKLSGALLAKEVFIQKIIKIKLRIQT